ncbi:MAG TPA: fibronectin type III domain-containing protein, partial [Candidatus Acidoferrales bacterium]|nr:fibronectin type III domain-containing protein [Candidatus Acidoferrales bacterium]
SLNNQLSNCVMNIVVNTTSGQGDVHGMMVATAAYNVIRNNVINITVTACQGYFFPLELYEGYNNTFLQNTWNVAMNSAPLGSRGMWSARDSSTYNRYIGNSVTITGPNQLSFMLSNPGSFAATVGHNMYANNVIRDDAPQDGLGVLYWYDGGRYDTLQYNVVTTSSGNPAVYMPNNAEATGIISRHNTYRVAGSTAADFGSASPVGAGTRFTSDIFYCGSSNSSRENLLVASGIGVDSAGVFFSLGSSSASRAISYGGSDGKPGSGAPYGFAGEAAWGSPQFADSSYANFNPALTATTLAAGAGFPDGFAGAIPFVGGSDVTPPGVVSNLALSQPGPTSLLVSWTAPGNDGSVGTASAYDLRWSRSPINATNFALATPVSPQPVPVVGGSPQSYVALNLASSTTYYFAIRAVDASGNWSAISNVPSATTSVGTDTTPPAAIRDLTAGP